jgi:hypothetical protein
VIQAEAEKYSLLPPFKSEVQRFLQGESKGSPGVLGKVNDRNRRINFLEKIISLIEDTRAEALALRVELGQ